MPSGIAAYVQNISAGLRKAGVDSRIFSIRPVEADFARSDVTDLTPYFDKKRSRLSLFLERNLIRRPIADVVGRATGRAINAAFREVGPGDRPQLLEVEETFGMANWIDTRTVPVVMRLHGPWFLNGPCYGESMGREFHARCRAEFRAAKAVIGITAPSDIVLRQFLKKVPQVNVPCAVIPNPTLPVSLQNMWGAGHCVGNRILFVSRFERIKGPDIMLRAFSRVLETVPDAELDFVGSDDGFIDDAGRTWTLQDYLAAHLPVQAVHRVKYHGRLPRERIEELRKVSRVAVIASRHENFPLAAIESMCAGTPTIGSDVGGIPEIIRDEQTGLLFRAGDAEHLASQIGRILLGPELSERLSAAAVGETSRFTSDAVALQTLGFYDTALAHAGKLRLKGGDK